MVAQTQNYTNTRRSGGFTYTRSLARNVEGQGIVTLCPVVTTGDAFAAQALFPVKGGIKIITPHSPVKLWNLDRRWCTLTADQVKEIVAIGFKDATIFKVRVPSSLNGNSNGPGVEDAYLVELKGSEAAEALAASIGVDYDFTVPVGEGETAVAVTHTNPIVISQNAMIMLHGGKLASVPGLPRQNAAPASRMDTSNPTLEAAVAFVKATGQLPTRARSNTRIITAEALDNVFA